MKKRPATFCLLSDSRWRPRKAAFAGTLLAALVACSGGGGGAGSNATPTPAPDFQIALSPSSLNLPAGTIGGVTVTLTRTGGFQGAVTLSLASAPSGVTYSGSIPANGGTGTFNLQVDPSVAPQTLSNLQVVGMAGSLSHGVPFALTVAAALPPGQLRADLVQAGGGTQTSTTWANQALTQEPVRTEASQGPSGTTKARHGFYPQGSPQK